MTNLHKTLRKLNMSVFIIALISLSLSNVVIASQHTANTIKVIEGRAPVVEDPSRLLDFLALERSGSIFNSQENNTIMLPAGALFDEYRLHLASIPSDSQQLIWQYLGISDPDGDKIIGIETDIADAKIQWFRNGGELTPQQRATMSLCNYYSDKFTVKLSLTKFKIKTQYGIPNETVINQPISKEYKIISDGLCWIKPENMYVWDRKIPDPQKGGGYITDEFDPNNGFIIDNLVRKKLVFPTVAFPGAIFSFGFKDPGPLLLQYQLTAIEPANILELQPGPVLKFKFIGEPKLGQPIKIKFTRKINGVAYPSEYRFSLNKWFYNSRSDKKYTFDNAVIGCGGQQNLPTRAEISNSPQSTLSDSSRTTYDLSRFVRSVSTESLMGQWGILTGTAGQPPSKSSYPDGNFIWGYLWTNETRPDNRQFVVGNYYGLINHFLKKGEVSYHYYVCIKRQ